jgi:hypothetical protein
MHSMRVADPPGIEMYYQVNGVWYCRRGTSAVESYHSKYHHLLQASHYSPEHAARKDSAFNHQWNVNAGIAHAGNKDWGSPDWRELEKLQALCEANSLGNPVPEPQPVKRLSPEEHERLQLSKLPLEAARAMGLEIPSPSQQATAPAGVPIVQPGDGESELRKFSMGHDCCQYAVENHDLLKLCILRR